MTLVYPVQWGMAIRGAHGSYRAPARCSALSGFLSAIREINFRYFAEEEKIQQNAKQIAENTQHFVFAEFFPPQQNNEK